MWWPVRRHELHEKVESLVPGHKRLTELCPRLVGRLVSPEVNTGDNVVMVGRGQYRPGLAGTARVDHRPAALSSNAVSPGRPEGTGESSGQRPGSRR
jgi:hypothetical protein